jgi:hypothetical protein
LGPNILQAYLRAEQSASCAVAFAFPRRGLSGRVGDAWCRRLNIQCRRARQAEAAPLDRFFAVDYKHLFGVAGMNMDF